jgi:hypothetical protein
MTCPGWLTRLCAEISSCNDAELRAHILQRAIAGLPALPDREREQVIEAITDAICGRDD